MVEGRDKGRSLYRFNFTMIEGVRLSVCGGDPLKILSKYR